MINQPYLVSVVILTYNRISVLIEILTKVINQNYKNIEIIVVNNNSTDGTKEELEIHFPTITLINLEKNIGVSGLNYGLKAAKGEYILQLDDDSYPENDAIEKGLKFFEEDNKLGILAFKIINTRFNICETENFNETTKLFIGCGVMFRKSMFSFTGYYNKNIFIYYNELDLVIRCYEFGYKVRFEPILVAFHLQTELTRNSGKQTPLRSKTRFKYHYLSYSTYLQSNFSNPSFFKYSLKLIVSNLITSIFYGYWKEYFITSVVVFYRLKSLFGKRKVLSRETQNLFDNGNFALIDRLFFPNFTKIRLFHIIKHK